MYLNDIIKSTLGLEDYNLYLEESEFPLADLSLDLSDIEQELADQEYQYKQKLFKDNPALEEIQYFIDDIEEDEEIDLYEFLN